MATCATHRSRWILATTTTALLGLAFSVAPAHAGNLAAAVRAANAVYPSVPQQCGTVKIHYGALTAENDTSGKIAEVYGECAVRIRPGVVETYSDAGVCSLLTHEWGHLAGREFPDNPADPHHSPNPADNMYGGWLVHHPACGESDDARAARQARENAARAAAMEEAEKREIRRADIKDKLSELKDELRATRAAKRRGRGATQARYERRIRRLRVRIRRLQAEYRSLAPAALL